ncbi:hypothetical protein BC830DRAFT_1132176 [Chytriomyces sp. MP71]|nr:hypothetical protein BC830DRAFT_1132176 [Chytriomyces sp. MP71]
MAGLGLSQLLQSSALAGSFFFIGDTATQAITGRQGLVAPSRDQELADSVTHFLRNDWDTQRTLKMAAFGLGVNGWYFLTGFHLLDKAFGPSKTLRVAALKAVSNQLLFVPPYSAGFLYYSAAFVHQSNNPDVTPWDSMVSKFPKVYAAGCALWPAVNVISFRFVPPGLPRVALMNGVGLCWSTYLATVAASSPEQVTPSSQLEKEALL